MHPDLTHDRSRLPLGRVLLNLAVIDCLVGVAGFLYLNVLHAGEVIVGVTPMGSAALTLMWMSWWLSVGGLAVAGLVAFVMPRTRELWLSMVINTVYVLPLALLLASRHLQLSDRL